MSDLVENGRPETCRGVRSIFVGPGSPFGETALLENLHRNATVVSESFSPGYQLTKADFDALRSRYPEFDQRVKAVAELRKRALG